MADNFEDKLAQFKQEAQEFAEKVQQNIKITQNPSENAFQNGNDILKNALNSEIKAPDFKAHLKELQDAKETIFVQRDKLLKQQIEIERILDNVERAEQILELKQEDKEDEVKIFELDTLDNEIETALNEMSDPDQDID
ncbi:hypothetical protein SS50377_26827 [Spironucleus salmonicida]|uniref:Uncharacterized protein n=1 Tax=Spironucleus salmonicida TaxID=348837 RepID=V6LZW1_9EUKA|nr:hypothetical protein SS50377_26827 [Spironucleus salmonicida]|eukprot:EST49296.1 Hypothetical protein SS50377_10519 [Spironucleus salmonicida]